MTTLFDPLKAGDLTLPNRIIMAPLTRSRAGTARARIIRACRMSVTVPI
jgi:2,4-dienoyl-CoA reductase-like NADH-dependent reductase (Old Yellow Enzyme family)